MSYPEPIQMKYLKTKRIFDILFSLLVLPFFLIMIMIFALIVFLTDFHSPFLCQKRLGLAGKEFGLFKIRSMHIHAEKDGAVWANKNDDRVLPIGKFMRQTRIDEMPQIFNILKGDMSWIGPRPERKELADRFSEKISNFPLRLQILPGLTGYAQVNGGYDLKPEEKIVYDLYYIKHVSLKLDGKILWKTIKVILFGEGAR